MKRITSLLLAIVLFAGLVLSGAPVAHAASEMVTSDALVEVLKKEEGFSAKPYWDYSQYTVGYGTRCPDDMLEEYQQNGITEEEADLLLRNNLTKMENALNKKLIDAYGLTLTQGQFDALVSFTYNCGTNWLNDPDGSLHKAIRKGTTGSELIRVFSLWCNAGGEILPGLVRRRLCEANMYLNGVYSTERPENYCFVYYSANGGSVAYRVQGYDANEGVAPAYTPTYEGHTFLGWYTAKTGGSKVTKLTKDLSGSTLYARWEGGEETEDKIPANGVSIKVTADDVNLRKGPGTNYGIVGTANTGDKLVITETASGSGYTWGNAGGKWIALKYTNYDSVVKEEEKVPEETTKPTEATEPETTEPKETEPKPTEPKPTEPEETKPAKVTGTVKANGGLALREGPGTGYAVIKYLDNGTKVTILEQKKAGSMTWGKVKEGWISMSYVVLDAVESEPETKPDTKPETSKPSETKLTGTIKADGGLALRKGPGFSYARIKYLANGTKVTILEQKKAEGVNWGRISEGWISMDYVVLDKTETKPEPTEPKPTEPKPTEPEETEPETKPTEPEDTKTEQTKLTGKVKADGGLTVRRGAGTSYGILRYLDNGAKVTIVEVKDVSGTKWGNIGDGWVCMDYVVLDQQKEESSAETKTVTADCLRVRKSPSTSAEIVGYYYEGAKVQILETKDVGGTKWGRTAKGWISMDYVK